MSIPTQAPAAPSRAASRSIGLASVATALAGLGYAVSFVILKDALLSALLLLLGWLGVWFLRARGGRRS
jgi:hypothetical protein